MFIVEMIERLIARLRYWHLASLLFCIMIVKAGIWVFPTEYQFVEIAQNPFTNPFTHPDEHYLFWNWLGPFLAWLIGATDARSYFLLHLAFSMAFTVLFARLAYLRLPRAHATSAIIFFFVLPVSATSYFWIGYDSLTLLLMTLILFRPQNIALTVAGGLALGMQHFEQGFFAAIGLLVAIVLTPPLMRPASAPLRFPLALIAGVILGKVALFVIFNHYGIVVNSGRMVWLKSHLSSLIFHFIRTAQFVVYAIFGVGWLVAARVFDDWRRAWPFCLGLLAIFSLLPIVEDSTRVFAITAFPLVAVFWLLNAEFLSRFTRGQVAAILGVWVLVPWIWAWGGIPQLGVFSYDMTLVSNAIMGWPELPKDLYFWPFNSP